MNTIDENSHLNGVSQFRFGTLFCVIFFAIVFGIFIIYPSEIKDAIWLMQKDTAESITIPFTADAMSSGLLFEVYRKSPMSSGDVD